MLPRGIRFFVQIVFRGFGAGVMKSINTKLNQ